MARSDYESLIAAKPVVRKIEGYRKRAGYPSKSQALAGILSELEQEKTLHESLAALIEELKQKVTEFKGKSKDATANAVIDSLLAVILRIMTLIGTQTPV